MNEALREARYAVRLLPDHAATLSVNAGATHYAGNPAQDITARFLQNGGVRVASGRVDGSWHATLRGEGASAEGEWRTQGPRAERIHSPTVTEWYENHPEGFEQGFTVHAPLGSGHDGWEELPLALSGVRAETDPEQAEKLRLCDLATGQAVLGYGDLKVWDAEGRELPSQMRVTEQGITLAFHVAGARYPVTVDPLLFSLETYYTIGWAQDRVGTAVSLTENSLGLMAAIGVPGDDNALGNNAGSIYLLHYGPSG